MRRRSLVLLVLLLWSGATSAGVDDLKRPVYRVHPALEVEAELPRVWESPYMPSDVLPAKMLEHFRSYLLDSAQVELAPPEEADFTLKLSIHRFDATKSDKLGTNERVLASGRISVEGKGGRLWWKPLSVRDARQSLLHKADLRTPVVWEEFRRSLTWHVLREMVFRAVEELLSGFQITGRVVAKLPGEETFLLNLGRFHALERGDLLEVLEPVKVRTEDAESPVAVLPRVKGRVRVIEVFDGQSRAELEEGEVSVGDPVRKNVKLRRF